MRIDTWNPIDILPTTVLQRIQHHRPPSYWLLMACCIPISARWQINRSYRNKVTSTTLLPSGSQSHRSALVKLSVVDEYHGWVRVSFRGSNNGLLLMLTTHNPGDDPSLIPRFCDCFVCSFQFRQKWWSPIGVCRRDGICSIFMYSQINSQSELNLHPLQICWRLYGWDGTNKLIAEWRIFAQHLTDRGINRSAVKFVNNSISI